MYGIEFNTKKQLVLVRLNHTIVIHIIRNLQKYFIKPILSVSTKKKHQYKHTIRLEKNVQ